MGNPEGQLPEGQLNEIRLLIQEIRREINVNEHFELGDAPRPLSRIENGLSKISGLLHERSDFYYSKSMREINLYDDAVKNIREAQKFLTSVRVKGEGSKENTLHFQTLMERLDQSIANLLQEDIPDTSVVINDLSNEKTETKPTSSITAERRMSGRKHSVLSDQSIFISYAWGGDSEKIVNQIDNALQERGLRIVRDKRDLGYKGSIKEFMERMGHGNCVIVVVSDKYLKSPNCMFELIEISDNKQFHDRVFPVVLGDADIYDPIKRVEYVKYWEEKKAGLDKALKTVSQENLQEIHEDMNLYDRIRDNISKLTGILKNMNTLTSEMHQNSNFEDLYNAIEERIGKSR